MKPGACERRTRRVVLDSLYGARANGGRGSCAGKAWDARVTGKEDLGLAAGREHLGVRAFGRSTRDSDDVKTVSESWV